MQYLKDPQYYIDLYDLRTIKHCLDHTDILRKVRTQMNTSKELEDHSDEEKENSMNLIFGRYMMNVMIMRYKDKEKTIKEWTESDKLKQDVYDNTPPPTGIKCKKCGSKMHVMMRDLEEENDILRIRFMFECDKCKARRAVYDNGEEWTYEPRKCEKCKSDIKSSIKKDGDITTWTYTCTKCDFKEIEKDDYKKWEMERKKKKEKDKQLLEKYRKQFCLSKKDAEKYISAFEELAFADEVYKYEVEKYSDTVYEAKHNLQKITVSELEELLSNKLAKDDYANLILKEPKLDNFVTVEFTIQSKNNDRNKDNNVTILKKLLKEILAPTNWRLQGNHLDYRLGYLTGILKGYERDEDIVTMLSKKKKKKPQKELDPEMMEKYGSGNAVKLARMCAEYEGEHRIKMKRYKNEPDGFILENHGDSQYSCTLCGKAIRGNETWWIPEALLCLNCIRNMREGVFPVEIFENHKLWFTTWDLEKEFDLYSATVRKHVRDGDLITRDLKDENGKIYHSFFMAEDNVEFFKKHPRKGKRQKRWHFVDEKGNIIWL